MLEFFITLIDSATKGSFFVSLLRFSILRFVLSRKIINIYNDIAQKHGNVTVKDFRKYEKLEYK